MIFGRDTRTSVQMDVEKLTETPQLRTTEVLQIYTRNTPLIVHSEHRKGNALKEAPHSNQKNQHEGSPMQ